MPGPVTASPAEAAGLVARLAELVRYGLVGGVASLLHFACQWAWHDLVGLPVIAAFWSAFAVAFTVSLLLHHRFTFRSPHRLARTWSRFLLVQVAQVGANFCLFLLLLRLLPAGPHSHLVAVVISTTLVQIAAYLAARSVFRSRPAAADC